MNNFVIYVTGNGMYCINCHGPGRRMSDSQTTGGTGDRGGKVVCVYEYVRGSEGITPHMLNLGTWQWTASRSGCFTSRYQLV
jgi:hypothetical protein